MPANNNSADARIAEPCRENDQPRPVNRYVRRRLPSAIRLGDRRIAFIRSEIMEQIQSRIDA